MLTSHCRRGLLTIPNAVAPIPYNCQRDCQASLKLTVIYMVQIYSETNITCIGKYKGICLFCKIFPKKTIAYIISQEWRGVLTIPNVVAPILYNSQRGCQAFLTVISILQVSSDTNIIDITNIKEYACSVEYPLIQAVPA